ncbi:MAG: RNB domain-containing ribonuclease [Pseudomonadota bacterium]
METGHVVEYIDQQQILCAVVMETADERLRLLTEMDREISLSRQRLSHTSKIRLNLAEGRVRMVHRLQEISLRRNALIQRVDIQRVWQALNERRDWIDLETMTGHCFPEGGNSDCESAVIRALFKDRSYFKFSHDRFLPLTAHQVQERIDSKAERARKAQLIRDGAAWLKDILAHDHRQPSAAEVAQWRPLVDALVSVTLHEKDSPHYTLVKAIIADVGLDGVDGIFSLLVRLGVFDPNENIDLLKRDVPLTFPEAALKRSEDLIRHPERLAANPRRQDLTMLPLMTIDGQATQDFDDALSIEDRGDHYRLGVHISDVGHFIKKGDPIDLAARRRCSSIYTPDRKIPMLPGGLSEGLCSLKAGEYRPALSLMIRLNQQFDVMGTAVIPSWVRVVHQFTYYEVNLMADDNRDIILLKGIAQHFRNSRLEWGAVPIVLPDINIWFDPEGEICVSRINRESPGRMLVSEIMIMANWLLAKQLSEKGLPAVFRSQSKPRELVLKDGNGTLFQHWMQRRLLSRFALNTGAQRHHGLGLDAYLTATSPIRKYVDLATQRQLRAMVGHEKPTSESEMAALIRDLEGPIGQVALIQRNRNRYWLLKYLAARIGTKEEALVLGRKRNGYQVLLKEYLLECALSASDGVSLKPGETVQATIQYVNPRKDILRVFLSP